MFRVFTTVGPHNSLERLAERSVGLVAVRPTLLCRCVAQLAALVALGCGDQVDYCAIHFAPFCGFPAEWPMLHTELHSRFGAVWEMNAPNEL